MAALKRALNSIATRVVGAPSPPLLKWGASYSPWTNRFIRGPCDFRPPANRRSYSRDEQGALAPVRRGMCASGRAVCAYALRR